TLIEAFAGALVGDATPVRQGLATSNNDRFLRRPWEYQRVQQGWVPFVKGAQGRVWFEPHDWSLNWLQNGVGVKVFNEMLYGSYSRTIKNEAWYFRRAVSFTTIGSRFAARAVRVPSS